MPRAGHPGPRIARSRAGLWYWEQMSVSNAIRSLTPGAWLNLVALVIGLAGSVLATNAFMTEEMALAVGLPRWADDSREENLKAPLVREFVEQGRDGRRGLALVGVAFVLQAAAILVDAARSPQRTETATPRPPTSGAIAGS